MTAMGMKNVEEVESLAGQLKTKAGEITGLVQNIEGLVNNLRANWDGKDADQFVNDWWPQHKKALTDAAHQIEGLGQSAHNNASAQRDISGH